MRYDREFLIEFVTTLTQARRGRSKAPPLTRIGAQRLLTKHGIVGLRSKKAILNTFEPIIMERERRYVRR